MYEPLKMRPAYKTYLWGGTRLKTEFGKVDAPEITAESWELACHPDGMSVVAEGVFAGKTIEELSAIDRKGFCGSDCAGDHFPILVKLIDAGEKLSIQVHPSDISAQGDEQGKAEMWYVVDCVPHASLYYGFRDRIGKEELLRRVQDGTICEVLNQVPVSKGDVFGILPGTIHAIGAGIVIAEVQQNSNTTFRIYDYQRRGADGKPRQLHLERAVEVLEYMPIIPEECRINSGVIFPEFSMTELFRCEHFHTWLLDVRSSAGLICDGRSFQHLLCVEGNCRICRGEKCYPMRCGESYFLPAALGEYQIDGAGRVLLSRL